MQSLHLNGDDFAAVLLQATILHTHTAPGDHVTHTATYLGRNVFLIPHGAHAGGTVIEKVQPGEVGAHEMTLDALKHGLIDRPETAPAPVRHASQSFRHIDPWAFQQEDLNVKTRLYLVEADCWAAELERTRVLQAEEPTGHSIVHLGIRDDGELVVLAQADDVFFILLPDPAP